MKKNMSLADKATRVIIGVIIAALYFTNVINGVVAVILLILAALFLLTSFISY